MPAQTLNSLLSLTPSNRRIVLSRRSFLATAILAAIGSIPVIGHAAKRSLKKPRKTEIIVAWGIDIRDWIDHEDLLEYLEQEKLFKKVVEGEHYRRKVKRRTYDVRLVYDKEGFRKALKKPGAIVIYHGHSRFGQGPAFGPKNTECEVDVSSVNHWNDHFRMGFDVVKIPLLSEHKNGSQPTEYSGKLLGKLTGKQSVRDGLRKANSDAGVRRAKRCDQKGWAKRRMQKCAPKAVKESEEWKNCRGETVAGRHYWLKSRNVFWSLVKSNDDDLKRTKLKCRVLFMNSCSSWGHYLSALKRHREMSDSKCLFFLTRRASDWGANTTTVFIKEIINGNSLSSSREVCAMLRALIHKSGNGHIDAHHHKHGAKYGCC